MKGKMNKILPALMLVCFGFGVAGCKDGKEDTPDVNLLDFTNVTETVELGDNYILPNSVVLDEQGADYRVDYEVKDGDGNLVEVQNKQFKLKDMGDAAYTVLCSATVFDEVVTRTITLNVKDTSPPVFYTNELPYAYVGKEYAFADILISDNSGEKILPSVVVKDGNGTLQQLTDGKFTPTTAGKYKVTISAQDSTGNKTEKESELIVRADMGKWVLDNFDDGYGTSKFSVDNAELTDEVLFHETFDPTPDDTGNGDERTGVLSAQSTKADFCQLYGPHFYFKLENSFKDVQNIEYIYVKAYLHSTIAEYRPTVNLYSINEALGENGEYPVNQWVEIRLTAEDIASANSEFANGVGPTNEDTLKDRITKDSGACLFYVQLLEYETPDGRVRDKCENYTLYVDEIGYKPYANPTVTLEKEYDLGETISLRPEVVTEDSEYTIETKVFSPAGAEVVLTDGSFLADVEGEYTVELFYHGQEQTGYRKYNFAVKGDKSFTIGELDEEYSQGDTVQIPVATLEDATVSVSVSVHGYEYPLASENTFVANVAGDFVVTYSATMEGLTYRKSITIKVAENTVDEKEIVGLDSLAEIQENTVAENGTVLEWLPVFEGETGVVKMSKTSDWLFFGFKPAQDMSAYADASYVVVRMYVCADATGTTLSLVADKNNCLTKVVVDQWVDYYFPAEAFKTNWADWETSYNTWTDALVASKAGTYYIDEIFVVEKEAVAANVISTFETAVDVSLSAIPENGTVLEWQAEHEGKTGVVKMSKTSDWLFFGFKPAQDMSAYANASYVVVRMYVCADATGTTLSLVADKNNCLTKVVVDQWVDYYFPAEPFKTNWADWETSYNTWTDALVASKAGTYYIDEIFVVEKEAVAANVISTFKTAVDVSLSAVPENGTVLEWQAEHEGETGVVKMSNTSNWLYFGFKPAQDMSAYANASYVVVRMYVCEDATAETVIKLGGSACLTEIKTGEWIDYYFDATSFKEKWANWQEKEYDAWTMCLEASLKGTYYIQGIYVADSLPNA